RDARKTAATPECRIPNACHAVRNCDACKTTFAGKCMFGDCLCSVSDAVCTRKSLACFDQMIAQIEDVVFPVAFIIVICSIMKRTIPNAYYAVGNRDSC